MNAPAASILVVDDEPDLRTLYELTLLREGYRVDTAATLLEARQQLQAKRFDVVISDMRLPDGFGMELLQDLRDQQRRERCVVMTAYGSAENAVEALRAGAFDYLTKPVDLKQFRSVVASAIQGTGGVPAPRAARGAHQGKSITALAGEPLASGSALDRLVGDSAAIRNVKQRIAKVARGMAPVLIHGESGTGKELVAQALHASSQRADGPLVAVNCGAIPENLLEAEFFGARKGSYTGASQDRDGYFQAARGGTLFLDEIGDLPLAMQSKLLRAIQERAVRPVGATQEIAVDVRLLSATHKDLQAEVKAGRFRQDLYYRLNVIQITLPALRERLEDLPELSARILERIAHETGMGAPATLSDTAMRALMHYPFPGNVRELENLLQRAVALSNHAILEAEDLGIACATTDTAPAPHDSTFEPTEPAPLPELEVPALAPAEPPPLPSDLATHLDHIERDILVRALEKHRLNRTAAGASLGLSLRQMRYRMARLGVQITDHGVVLGERFDPDVE